MKIAKINELLAEHAENKGLFRRVFWDSTGVKGLRMQIEAAEAVGRDEVDDDVLKALIEARFERVQDTERGYAQNPDRATNILYRALAEELARSTHDPDVLRATRSYADHEIGFFVGTLMGHKLEFKLSRFHRVRRLKEAITEQLGQPVDAQKIIFDRQLCEDEKSLEDYGIEDGSQPNLVLKLGGD